MTREAEALLSLLKIAFGKEDVRSLPNDVNWDEVYALSLRQNVIALTWSEELSQYSESLGIDDDLKYKWIGQQTVVVMKNRSYWGSAQRLSRLWMEKGLKPVVLKGLSYAVLYPNPLQRRCCDLDSFLFDGWEEGNKIVEKTGVKVSRSYYKDSSFYFGNVFVENHRYCSPIRGDKSRKSYERYLRSLLVERPLDKISGTEFYTPPPLFNVLFFFSHAYNHFMHEGGIQLRHVCDLGVLIDTYQNGKVDLGMGSADFWKTVLEKCEDYGLLKFSTSLIQVSKMVCGTKIPFVCPKNEEADNAMLEEILYPTCVQVEFSKGWHTRKLLLKSILQSRWKFKLYSERTMISSLFGSLWAFVFEKKPELE